jgi:hypothetical protein
VDSKKGKMALSEILKEEEFFKELQALDDQLKTLERLSKMFDRAASTADKAIDQFAKVVMTDKSLTEDEKASRLLTFRSSIALPKLIDPVQGLTVEYVSSRHILPEDYDRLAAFIDRNRDRPLWYAPQEALGTDGKPVPLSKEAESWLLKNSKKAKPVARLEPHDREMIAWRWLIVSYNHLNPLQRVNLHPRLSARYDRKVVAGKPVAGKEISPELLIALREAISGMTASSQVHSQQDGPDLELYPKAAVWSIVSACVTVIQELTAQGASFDTETGRFAEKSPSKKNGFAAVVQRANDFMVHTEKILEGGAIEDLPAPSYDVTPLTTILDRVEASPVGEDGTPDDGVSLSAWEKANPESFDDEGMTWFREDIDLISAHPNQAFLTKVVNGVEYHAFGKSAPAVAAESSKQGALREQRNLQQAKPSPGRKESAGNSGLKPSLPLPKQPKKEVPISGKGKAPVEEDNPLHVKGTPKSRALSLEQRHALRRHFGLEEGLVDSESWSVMSAKEKSLALKARSIPRWASEAVLRHSDNLQAILEGRLTKDNMTSVARVAPPKSNNRTAQAMEAWQALKSDFKGTALLRRPLSQKEKAFKKRFDQLVTAYGQQPCFPKLKERPDQQGQVSSSTGRASSVRGGASEVLDIAKAFGEIARAFSGK